MDTGGTSLAPRWFVYIVRCSDDTLYTGITVNVKNRLRCHNNTAKGAKYTRTRRPVAVVCTAGPVSRSHAQKLERAVKSKPRNKKVSFLKSKAGRYR